MTSSSFITPIQTYLGSLQKTICQTLAAVDAQKTFDSDQWKSALGVGTSCVLQQGKVFEKAGVNVSHVAGNDLPPTATQGRPQLAGAGFEALGLSLVVHPHNPYVPTTHANIRFFIAIPKHQPPVWWFGGGFDLTPYYGFVEDCMHWHQMAKQACDPYGSDLYARLKKQCDDYFYLPHRQEARGIGGIFFDDFNEMTFENSFNFIQSVGDHFLKGYLPIVERRMYTAYGEQEKIFQCYRRGRYVEFNLIYDRGTLFGLQSKGRTESILMSLPPEVTWRYDWHPEPNSPEAKLYTDFLPVREWI